jgi:glycosyltransferase involved in cell wall biosynthesis
MMPHTIDDAMPRPTRIRRAARLLKRLRGRPMPRDVGRFSEKLKVVVVSDAAPPQVNGVVRTLQKLNEELTAAGHEVVSITPDQFVTIPMPSYPEIRLALFPGRKVARLIKQADPNAIHIATEGPLGLAARNFCTRKGIPFSTSFHTRFAEYLNARTGAPLSWGYAFLRWFHSGATTIMVATRSLQAELEARGFGKPSIWSRGVDTDLYRPRSDLLGEHFLGLPRPVYLYVGRVAVEKNIEAFLDLDLPGSKMVVGDGPRLEHLRKRHPEAHFAGAMFGEELAKAYAAADCFVFPSRTDTFGLVLIEALASGTPVAAYPVQGPLDVIGTAPVAVLDEDLKAACLGAISLSRAAARDFALGFSWDACTRQFLSNLALEEEAPPALEKLTVEVA